MRINRRFTIQLMGQVFGALFLSSCGINGGFATLMNDPLKPDNTDNFKDNAVLDPYGSCQAGDIYGYGYSSDSYGHGSYGYGYCNSMDDYGLNRDLKGYEYNGNPQPQGPPPAAPAPAPTPTPEPVPAQS